MKTCEDFLCDAMLEYSGELNNKDSQLLHDHLKSCQNCKEEVYQLEETLEQYEGLPVIEAPKELEDKVRTSLKDESEQSYFMPLWLSVAAVLLLACGGFWILSTLSPKIQEPQTEVEPVTELSEFELDVFADNTSVSRIRFQNYPKVTGIRNSSKNKITGYMPARLTTLRNHINQLKQEDIFQGDKVE